MAWNGWVKKYRKVMDSVIWADPYQYKLFDMLVMMANHEAGKVVFGGKEIPVSSGEVVTGRDTLASLYNKGAKPVHQKSPRVLWRWIKNFEKAGMLSIKSTTKYSVISITNWAKYQENVQQVSINGPANVQQVSTNKNDKNVKNESSSSSTRKDVFQFWEQNGFGQLPPKTMEDLDYWVKDLQEIGSTEEQANQLLIKAMTVAIDSGVLRYKYVAGVLKNWEGKRLASPEAVDAYEAQRIAQKQPRNSNRRPSPDILTDPTDDDLPF